MKPDLDAIEARLAKTAIGMRAPMSEQATAIGTLIKSDIPALLAYIAELESKVTELEDERRWA